MSTADDLPFSKAKQLRATRQKANARQTAKAQRHRQHRESRAAALGAALKRDHFKCRACGSAKNLDGHELVFRSQGGDPTDVRCVIMLCRSCHEAIHNHRLTATPTSLDMANHDVIFRTSDSGWVSPCPTCGRVL